MIFYSKKNILLNNDVHVFATMQNANTIESNKIIKTHIGSHLKSLTHFCKSDILWNSIQDNLLNNIVLSGVKNISKVILRKITNSVVKEDGKFNKKTLI